jgi:hypothetical protein
MIMTGDLNNLMEKLDAISNRQKQLKKDVQSSISNLAVTMVSFSTELSNVPAGKNKVTDTAKLIKKYFGPNLIGQLTQNQLKSSTEQYDQNTDQMDANTE